jgi:pimeloyl-ACP methyl ester carboxylesterase
VTVRTEYVPVRPTVRLAVDRWEGDGTPFLLVHGLASNARLWDGVAAALHAAGHPVATVDQRGHGRSDKPDDGYDMATVADDLAAVVERLGFEQPVVAGQSWGGNVVLELAHRHPGAVGAIGCVDGGWLHLRDHFPSWEDCADVLRPPALAGTPRARVEHFVRAAHPDWPETGIQGALANFEVLADGTVRPWLTLDRHLQVLHGLWEHSPREHYASVRVPVLLAPADGGPRDPMAARKRREVEEAAAALPDARVHWFSPADHDVHAQHPEALADALRELA